MRSMKVEQHRSYHMSTCWKHRENRIELEPTGNAQQRKTENHVETNSLQQRERSRERMQGSQFTRNPTEPNTMAQLRGEPKLLRGLRRKLVIILYHRTPLENEANLGSLTISDFALAQ